LTTLALDASVALAWVLEETDVRAALARQTVENGQAVVPRLWWFEMRNGLIVNERRGRIDDLLTERFLRDLSRYAISFDDAPDGSRIMALARRHRLTVYDAAYLELALREGVPLATLDGPLANAARTEGVPVLGE
jgi:predicted nucleic acid-binding protein